MSQRLINRSPDLKRLRDEGYDIEVTTSGFLLLKSVSYLGAGKQVKSATIVSKLDLSGDRTAPPGDHTVRFTGEHPCNLDGSLMIKVVNESVETKLDEGLVIYHSFSSKPAGGNYADYYLKMTSYVAMIMNPALAVDPTLIVKTFPVVKDDPEEDSPFQYSDTASSRAEIVSAMGKLKLGKVAVVGVGGTGSYVVDLIAKTPIKEIHLFDGDTFLQHNAFRAPGAPSEQELDEAPKKVEYLKQRYSKMHKGIIPHDYFLNENNVSELEGMDFVFVCVDASEHKKHVVEKLEALGISFVDTGIDVYLVDEALSGNVRLTTSTRDKHDHFKARVGFADPEDNEYNQNIQIADLNAFNAALAVIKWKKLFGFYKDHEREHHFTYDIDGNYIHNNDQPEI